MAPVGSLVLRALSSLYDVGKAEKECLDTAAKAIKVPVRRPASAIGLSVHPKFAISIV